MKQEFYSRHDVDEAGMPAGGVSRCEGMDIRWQNGPLGRGEERQVPNGAFVETLIAAAVDRIEFYQTTSDGRFAWEENARAIEHLTAALEVLEERTRKREARGVEGTHEQ